MYRDAANIQWHINGDYMFSCCASISSDGSGQEREYDHRDYNQLPDLFDIEAILSPNRDNVTLVINGTECSNHLTIMCWNEDVLTGQVQNLFILILEFIGKFINQT